MCRRRDQLRLQPDSQPARLPAHHAGAARRGRPAWPPPGPRTPFDCCGRCCDRRNSSTARSTPRPTKASTTASQKGSAASSPSAIWCAGTTSAATWSSPIAGSGPGLFSEPRNSPARTSHHSMTSTCIPFSTGPTSTWWSCSITSGRSEASDGPTFSATRTGPSSNRRRCGGSSPTSSERSVRPGVWSAPPRDRTAP